MVDWGVRIILDICSERRLVRWGSGGARLGFYFLDQASALIPQH